jgi:hypothetical protein
MTLDYVICFNEEKGALLCKAGSLIYQGCVSAASGKLGEAVALIIAGIADYRSTGATALLTAFRQSLRRLWSI